MASSPTQPNTTVTSGAYPHPELAIDCEVERAQIVAFIQHQFAATGMERAVLGLSGGIDSALVAALCADALGPATVFTLILPYETSNPHSARDALAVAEQLGVSCETLDITAMARPLLARDPSMSPQRLGNALARCRMVVLFDESARRGGLVVGTSNRTEWLLGYFTLYGDGAAAMEPLGHLFKCQVRALGHYLGLPDAVLAKAPSADLWPGQTDEADLGLGYDQADLALYLLCERGLSEAETAAEGARHGLKPSAIAEVQARLRATAFKRRLPPSLPIIRRTRPGGAAGAR